MQTAQEIFNSDFLEKEEQTSNETLDLLEFMKKKSVPFTDKQIKAMLLLKENGLDDLINLAITFKSEVTPTEVYYKTIDKLTLADRIKGNAKLSHLVKSEGMANPAAGLKAKDMRVEGMNRRDLQQGY